MKQYYFYSFLLICFLLFTPNIQAQSIGQNEIRSEIPIEGLSIYPNPATGNKVYITSDNNRSKEVEVYNVLGKRVLVATVNAKEMDISSLTSGIYILKIREGNKQATRKLVIR